MPIHLPIVATLASSSSGTVAAGAGAAAAGAAHACHQSDACSDAVSKAAGDVSSSGALAFAGRVAENMRSLAPLPLATGGFGLRQGASARAIIETGLGVVIGGGDPEAPTIDGDTGEVSTPVAEAPERGVVTEAPSPLSPNEGFHIADTTVLNSEGSRPPELLLDTVQHQDAAAVDADPRRALTHAQDALVAYDGEHGLIASGALLHLGDPSDRPEDSDHFIDALARLRDAHAHLTENYADRDPDLHAVELALQNALTHAPELATDYRDSSSDVSTAASWQRAVLYAIDIQSRMAAVDLERRHGLFDEAEASRLMTQSVRDFFHNHPVEDGDERLYRPAFSDAASLRTATAGRRIRSNVALELLRSGEENARTLRIFLNSVALVARDISRAGASHDEVGRLASLIEEEAALRHLTTSAVLTGYSGLFGGTDLDFAAATRALQARNDAEQLGRIDRLVAVINGPSGQRTFSRGYIEDLRRNVAAVIEEYGQPVDRQAHRRAYLTVQPGAWAAVHGQRIWQGMADGARAALQWNSGR